MTTQDKRHLAIIVVCGLALVIMAGAHIRPTAPVLIGATVLEKLVNLVAGLSVGEMIAVAVVLGLIEFAVMWDAFGKKW